MAVVANQSRCSICRLSTRRCTARSSPHGAAFCIEGSFVSGAEIAAFEREFAAACEVEHCVTVPSGTDALVLALRALGVKRGDRVIVPANTFFATAEAVSLVGAVLALVDCDPLTRTISVEAVDAELRARGAVGVIAVHLYGHPADVSALDRVAAAHGVWVFEDAAQAHLARADGVRVGGLGRSAAFSFYPSKNLGATGEGGAVTTNDAAVADAVRALRHHGQTHGPPPRADRHQRPAVGASGGRVAHQAPPSRALEPSSAAASPRATRRAWQAASQVRLPYTAPWAEPVWHLYCVEIARRDAVRAALHGDGDRYRGALPDADPPPACVRVARAAARARSPRPNEAPTRVLSLPMFPELTDEQVDRVVDGLLTATSRSWR